MNAAEIVNFLKVFEQDQRHQAYGIRTEDRELKVGDKLGCSHDWDIEHDCQSDELLPGICATGIGWLWLNNPGDDDSFADDVAAVQEALDTNNKYCGDHQYLIGGRFVDYGYDPDESIIADAVVLAVIR